MRTRFTLLFFLSILFTSAASGQQSVTTRVLKDSLYIPWEIIYGADNHLWFTQKNGYVCRMDTAGNHTDTVLYEPSTNIIGEGGMLGMALHPHFLTNPYVYVAQAFLRLPDNAIMLRVSRYTWFAAANVLISPQILLDSVRAAVFHNGCRLLIADDKLFISLGDATDTTAPQNIARLNGKILRINLDGSIPADNPFADNPVWSYGHRNPQGMVMVNGILYASEHGPDTDDELNMIEKGANYGWPYVWGFCDKPGEQAFCGSTAVKPPLYAWTPTIATSGIDYYNHAMFPALRKSLLMASLKDKHLYRLSLNDDGTAITSATIVDGIDYGRLRDICISPEGKVYITTSNSNVDGKQPFFDKIIEVSNPDYHHRPQAGFVIYPNPATDELYVLPQTSPGPLTYVVYDMLGRQAIRGIITDYATSISLVTLPQGIFRIEFWEAGSLITSERFIHLH